MGFKALTALYLTLTLIFMAHSFNLFGGLEDEKSIKSAAFARLDDYRNEMRKKATEIDAMLRYISAMDSIDHGMKHVFTTLRASFTEIPARWAANYDFLSTDLLDTTDLEISTAILGRDAFVPTSMSESHTAPTLAEAAGTTQQSSSDDAASYSTIFQIMVHLRRDWTDQGAEVRQRIYGSMVRALATHMEDKSQAQGRPRILIPGAGLSRLALEIAHGIGAAVDCCESSKIFALATRNLFKSAAAGKSHTFYPLIHTPFQDDWDFATRLEPFHTPDKGEAVRAWREGKVQGSVSLQLANCSTFYREASFASSFDAVASSFFIDTGDVLQNIAIIAHVLRPGGVWVNAGPLHYHQPSLPLSHKDVLALAASMGFELVHEERIVSDYAGESRVSMKPEHYEIPLCVWRLARPEERLSPEATAMMSHFMNTAHEPNQNASVITGQGKAEWPSPNFKLVP